MEMLPINLVNKEQNNEYICTNKSFYTTHLEKIRIHGKNKSRGIEMVRSLQQVDIQAIIDLISEIYIPLTLVCTYTNYVGISCCALKMMFNKIHEDSQFNKLKTFDSRVLKDIFSYIISRDIKTTWGQVYVL